MEIHGKVAIAFKEYQRLLRSDEELKKILKGKQPNEVRNLEKAENLHGEGIAALTLPFDTPENKELPLASKPAFIIKEDPILPLDISNAAKVLPEPSFEPIVSVAAINEVPQDTKNNSQIRRWWYLGSLD